MCDFSNPNFYDFHSPLTNDPLWNQQCGLLNIGQYNGTSSADIRVVPAWVFTKGLNIKVAVIDMGVELSHPDLSGNLLTGFDAFAGVSAGGNDANDKHGTNCAGIIGAISDNNLGISGVAPECKVIPIRAFTSRNGGSSQTFARAINLAWENGADVISNSWRTGLQSDLIDLSILRATTLGRGGNGCVVVFAAGNGNSSGGLEYPGKLPEVIAVGNMSMCNTRRSPTSCDNTNGYSSYGFDLDITAPGVKIATLDINGSTRTDFSGTSAACPHVAGVAALVLSVNPNLTLSEVRRILQYSCNKVGPYCYNWTSAHPDGAWNNEMGYGRINAYNAVQLALYATSFSTPSYNINSQNNALVSGSNFQLIMGASSCSGLSAGVYSVQRYEVTTNITYPYTNNPLIISNSNGWSAANPNDGKNFATALNITNTSATLKSWVYKGYNSIGQFLGWFPTTPENVKFNYTVIGTNTNIDYQYFKSSFSPSQSKALSSISYEFDELGLINDKPITSKENKFIISPNPASDIAYLRCTLKSDERILSLEIFSIDGHLINVINCNYKNLTHSIDITKLPKGVYLVKINTSRNIYFDKIIKQ